MNFTKLFLFGIVAILFLTFSMLGCTSPPVSPAVPPDVPPAVPDSPAVSTPVAKEIKMEAKQYEFLPSVITVKKGEKVRLVITSMDVAHGVGSAELNFNVRVPAGETRNVEFTPNKVGEFMFRCSTFCGSGHSSMTGKIVVTE